MLSAISYQEISRFPDLFFGQHQLRHREFIERQHYDVRTLDGMEFDEYDTLASVYLVYSEDGKTVLGCSRLTPVDFGCMLRDHFPDLVVDHSVFTRARVWEGTRFCVDSQLPAPKRAAILQTIVAGYVEYAMHRGIDQIIGLMPTLILRSVFERNGIALARLGAAAPVGDHSRIQAAAITISADLLQAVRRRTGLSSVLDFSQPSKTSRHAA